MFYNLIIAIIFGLFFIGCVFVGIRYAIVAVSPRTPVLFLERASRTMWLLAAGILVVYIVLWVLGVDIMR
jgi:hypothetical protein